MKRWTILVVLTSTALGLVGCATTKAPKCDGNYTPVNPPNCYTLPADTADANHAPRVCRVAPENQNKSIVEGLKQ